MDEQRDIEAFLNRPHITLDLIGLTEAERAEGSMLLGGSGAKLISPSDEFEYKDVSGVVFRWGDTRVEAVFAALLEHIESPNAHIFPFSPSAVIDDMLWSLTLQDQDFDPATAYRSDSHYSVLPFDQEQASVALGEYLALPTPRPELLGKVWSRWVLFGIGTSIATETEPIEDIETEGALFLLSSLVDSWDFDNQPIEASRNFATHIAHWVLETFGQKSNDGEYTVFPAASFGDGFDGEDLPQGLQHLVTHTWKDEMFLAKDNNVRMQSQHETMEIEDAYIPNWEEIEQLKTFKEQIEYVRSHPEIRDAVKVPRIGVIPQVALTFTPAFHMDWGLEFLVSQLGIKVAPFGKEAKTWVPLNFVMENQHKEKELARIVCDLAILGAKHTYNPKMIPWGQMELLDKRLKGESPLPLCTSKVELRTGSAIKRLIVETILKEEE